ncbi:MAG: outer membrane beta-barrel protein [Pseudomonadota bacterium]
MKSMTLAALALVAAIAAAPATAQDRRPVYGSLYGGGSMFDVEFEFGGELGFEPEEDGDTLGVGLGYEINDNWFIQLDYTYTDASDVEIQQGLLSLNYQRPLFIPGMRGFVGLVVGEGSLDWNDQPDFADAIRDDLDADEDLIGLQLGLNYDLARHWSISLMYQVFDQEFNTNIETPDNGRLNFEHNGHQYLLFGLRFHL